MSSGAQGTIVKALGTLAARGGASGRLAILIFHRVLPAPDPLLAEELDRAGFEAHIRFLAENFTILPLCEAVERLGSRSLPPRALSITFDDGYANNAEVALPVLRKYEVTATFFVASGFLDGGRMWNDVVIEALRQASEPTLRLGPLGLGDHDVASTEARRETLSRILAALKYRPQAERDDVAAGIAAAVGAGVPDGLMMSSDQVRTLHRAGMEIGAHTLTHPILSALDAHAARAEIHEGRARLQELLRQPVRLFAYPNGKPGDDYRAEHVAMVKEAGFAAAFSTSWGAAGPGADLFQLPRFTPWDKSPFKFALRLVRNYLETRPKALAWAE